MDDLAIVDHPQCSICLEDGKTLWKVQTSDVGKNPATNGKPRPQNGRFFWVGMKLKYFGKPLTLDVFSSLKKQG